MYKNLFVWLWGSWAFYWWVAARKTKKSVRRESFGARMSYLVPLGLAVVLLGRARFPFPNLDARFLPASPMVPWFGAALTAFGLLFSIWARSYLGSNWSGTVTIKEGHELITSGPYSLVRHPIYTGLLIAFVGSAIARGEWRAIVAVVLAGYSFWLKLKREEKWLSEEFGENYRSYCQRVAALIPFVL